ncbi:putative protein MSS51 homolog, mitochondrial [Pollicipes pollicipes]|uniref:putative protein MSS51 homolog, mitochondrial n=1 Tax=Pollicipes pollicipes TaxID=41117 RepID=UPI00188569F1|nr:putative protein MSS51 homolog, mitochondrial [Pollicipes pollicipes]
MSAEVAEEGGGGGGGGEVLDVPPHYYPGACFVCKATPPPGGSLSRCANCRMIKYCSKEHQKLDWPLHKTICKKLRNDDGSSVLADGAGIVDGQEWLRHRASQTLALRLMLGRELRQHEKEMLFFPPVCECCHRFRPAEQIECRRCHSAIYCGAEHAAQDATRHGRWCESLRLALACDRYEARLGLADPPILPDVDEQYAPLPADIVTMLSSQILAEREAVPDGAYVDPVLIAFLTERLSFPLTVLHALQRLPAGRPVQELERLTVHVVGAQMLVECLGIIKWEYLVHRLPALRAIRLVFVGPELFRGCGRDMAGAVEDSGATRCEDCTRRQRDVVHEMRPTTYHAYCRGPHWTRPDVVVCFNSGIHEFAEREEDTWRESLPFLVRHDDVPLILTAYTRTELDRDLAQLERAVPDLRTRLEPAKNPYGSTKPVRDMCREDDCDVFFLNQFLAVVQGSGGGDASPCR